MTKMILQPGRVWCVQTARFCIFPVLWDTSAASGAEDAEDETGVGEGVGLRSRKHTPRPTSGVWRRAAAGTSEFPLSSCGLASLPASVSGADAGLTGRRVCLLRPGGHWFGRVWCGGILSIPTAPCGRRDGAA